MALHTTREINGEAKLVIKDKIECEIFEDGFYYGMIGESIQELIWEFIYRNVKFYGNETKSEWKLTLEEIK